VNREGVASDECVLLEQQKSIAVAKHKENASEFRKRTSAVYNS